jgi:hypothetical protein
LFVAVRGYQDELGGFAEIESLMPQGRQVRDGFVPQRADIELMAGSCCDQPTTLIGISAAEMIDLRG